MLEWSSLSLSKANLGPRGNDFDLTRVVSQCMHAHRVCDMPQGTEGVDSVTGCVRRAYEAQGAVIYLRDDNWIMATFGQNLSKWVNPVLEGSHVYPDPTDETLLLPDDTTGVALVMQTTRGIPTTLTGTSGAH